MLNFSKLYMSDFIVFIMSKQGPKDEPKPKTTWKLDLSSFRKFVYWSKDGQSHLLLSRIKAQIKA